MQMRNTTSVCVCVCESVCVSSSLCETGVKETGNRFTRHDNIQGRKQRGFLCVCVCD